MCSSVHKLPSHALQFLQSSVLEFFCQWKSRRHVKSFKAHSCLITMAPDHFPNPLLAYWEECWGPCSPMHTVPASSACSSATPDLSSSHTEWMEPPEECGHKRRNGISAECYHPSTAPCTHATNRYVCPRIYTQTLPTSLGVIGCWGLKKKRRKKWLYFIMKTEWMGLCAPWMQEFSNVRFCWEIRFRSLSDRWLSMQDWWGGRAEGGCHGVFRLLFWH